MNNKTLYIAIAAAVEASAEIMKIYQSDVFGVEMKSDNSPLTLADKAAHAVIVRHLNHTSFPVLSEEGVGVDYQLRKHWDTFWMVDPLDGTKEFIHRNGEFTVNIALIEKQEPILGVVVVPVTGVIYFASLAGAYKSVVSENIETIVAKAVSLPFSKEYSDFRVVGSRSHQNVETEAYISGLETNGKPLTMVSRGSSLKFCLVAEGEADVYPRLAPTMEWDTAAGHAVAKYSGKKVTAYPSGESLIYNKENLLNSHFVVR